MHREVYRWPLVVLVDICLLFQIVFQIDDPRIYLDVRPIDRNILAVIFLEILNCSIWLHIVLGMTLEIPSWSILPIQKFPIL